MKNRLILSVGLAAGYVLGARAGRSRYETIARTTRRLLDRPEVQTTAGVLQAQATQFARIRAAPRPGCGRPGRERPLELSADDRGPLADLLDLLARRHVLAVVWELRGRPVAFSTLLGVVAVAPAVLTQRLRELRDAGLVEVDEAGDYRLTAHGRRLLGPLGELAAFAGAWAALTPRQRTPRGSTDRGRGEP